MTSGASYPAYAPYHTIRQQLHDQNCTSYDARCVPLAEHYFDHYLDHHQQPIYPQYVYPQFSPIMAGSDPSEMEDFQRLSDQYQADIPGPLIGDKLPMATLVEEYTAADPTFVVKTQTLAATYSGYRRVKGDGQCGWRGAVFGYFEMLLLLGDIQLVIQEEIRIQSFADTMRMAGIDYDIIVDMFDFTWELFADLKKAVERQDQTDTVLLESLNDEIKSDSIVYHFKMMTSAFLALNPDNYEPFLEMPVDDYRVARINPSSQEIDQVGLQILTDGVIAQAGFAVDVLYLDRSIGDEVTPHEFAPRNQGGPTIRLLYRPGHYDLIYKDDYGTDLSHQGGAIPVTTSLQNDPFVRSEAYSYASPGSRTDNSSQQASQSTATPQNLGSHSHAYAFPDQTCYLSPTDPESISSHALIQPSNTQHLTTQCASLPPPSWTLKKAQIQKTSLPTLPAIRVPNPDEPQIRFVGMCRELERNHESLPLSSEYTGSSAASISTAHFRNQDFQPQMWSIEDSSRTKSDTGISCN